MALTPGNITCLRCGYDLAGLAPSQVCPECALPVDRSLHGDLLRYADDAYLGRVWLGTQCVILFLALHALLTFASCTVPWMTSMLGVASSAVGTYYLVHRYAALALAVGMLVATWVQTSHDPGQLSQHRGERLRIAVRVCLALQALGAMGSALAWSLTPRQSATMAFTTFYWITALALFVTHNLYMLWLVRRLPSERLGTSLRMLIIFGSGSLTLNFASWVLVLIVNFQSGGIAPTRFWTFYQYLQVPLVLMSLAAVFWQMAAYSKAGREFARARMSSREERLPSVTG